MKRTPAQKSLFFTRDDVTDPRLGEFVTSFDDEGASLDAGIVILGYPDDDGIELNGGRLGASQGPDAIRERLYRMTPSLSAGSPSAIWDAGNLDTDASLTQRHADARGFCLNQYMGGQRLLTLGGGHDYGYPDAAAFADHCSTLGQKPLVLNFDAHLDVRATSKGPSSGTPFRRLLEAFDPIDFAEIGIQDTCNSRGHLTWVHEKGGRVILLNQILESAQTLQSLLEDRLGDWLLPGRPTFISIDIDAFSSSFAMGCSHSLPTGLTPNAFLPAFHRLLSTLDVYGVGIYEVSPPLDQDKRTATLAATLAHRFIFSTLSQNAEQV